MILLLVASIVAAQRPPISRAGAAATRRRRWYNCRDPSGQAYGAAWLAHKATVLKHDVPIRDNTNMESGGWMPAKVATPLQSVDLLDCAVEHLSWHDLGVPRCCGAFTPSTRVVSRRGGRGWFLF